LTSASGEPIGVFGGTFDPIHYGHLRTAFELYERLRLARIHFVPCGTPPHRGAKTTPAALRWRMVQAAVTGHPGFVADDREIARGGLSYTADTLESFRAEYPTQPLCLLLGMDAFLSLPQWHRWQDLLDLGHLVVAHRPGWLAPQTGTLGALLRARRSLDIDDLRRSPAGRVHVEAVTQLEISSTDLRASLKAGLDPKFLMPDSVCNIITETECYAENS
jgi:nicotinate-nucleotide adenylyltransferase